MWGPGESQGRVLLSVDAAVCSGGSRMDMNLFALLGLPDKDQSLALFYLLVGMYT